MKDTIEPTDKEEKIKTSQHKKLLKICQFKPKFKRKEIETKKERSNLQ
jgi:hypothetical protein